MTEASPTFRNKLEFAGLSSLVWIVGRLPFFWLRPVANVFGAVAYVFDQRGRSVALANLDAAFGTTLSTERKKQIARGSYQTFARSMLELFWSPNLTEDFVRKHIKIEGLELETCHNDDQQSGIYLCLHYSNFEWIAQVSAYVVRSGPVITQRFRNPLLGQIFDRMRASTGNHIIPQERAMIRMLKYLKEGGKFGVLSDLNIDPKEGAVLINTFNGLTLCATPLPAALASRTDAKIIPTECRPLPDGTYRIIYHKALEYPVGATAAEITQLCWNVLEPSIHEQPECWLWPYKHWRFKPVDDTTGRYPFYANVAKRFDKLIRESAKTP